MNGREGRKYDGGKRRWDLMRWEELGEVVDVLTDGSVKYDDENYKFVDQPLKRYPAAAMRHIHARLCGETHDPDTGRRHLACAIANLLFWMWHDTWEVSDEGRIAPRQAES